MSELAGPNAAVPQIWMPGADHNCAAAHNWIKQAAAARKTPSAQTREKPAEGEALAGAGADDPSEHMT